MSDRWTVDWHPGHRVFIHRLWIDDYRYIEVAHKDELLPKEIEAETKLMAEPLMRTCYHCQGKDDVRMHGSSAGMLYTCRPCRESR